MQKGVFAPHPNKTGNGLMFPTITSYVWWAIRQGRIPFAFLIRQLLWWPVFRLARLAALLSYRSR